MHANFSLPRNFDLLVHKATNGDEALCMRAIQHLRSTRSFVFISRLKPKDITAAIEEVNLLAKYRECAPKPV